MIYAICDEVTIHHVSDEELEAAIAGNFIWNESRAQHNNRWIRNDSLDGTKGTITHVSNIAVTDACPYRVEFGDPVVVGYMWLNEINIRPINKKQLQLEVVL